MNQPEARESDFWVGYFSGLVTAILAALITSWVC